MTVYDVDFEQVMPVLLKLSKIPPYLTLPVDANDPTSSIMRSSNKDGVSTDSVHVDTCTALNVIQMDIAILGDEKDDAMLFTHLKITHP